MGVWRGLYTGVHPLKPSPCCSSIVACSRYLPLSSPLLPFPPLLSPFLLTSLLLFLFFVLSFIYFNHRLIRSSEHQEVCNAIGMVCAARITFASSLVSLLPPFLLSLLFYLFSLSSISSPRTGSSGGLTYSFTHRKLLPCPSLPPYRISYLSLF